MNLTLTIEHLDYDTLSRDYASAIGISLEMEDPQIVEAGVTVPLQEELTKHTEQGVQVRVISDSYKINAYVLDPNMKLADLVGALGLHATIDNTPKNPSLMFQSVGPDSNCEADKDPAGLQAENLTNWRRWVVFERNYALDKANP